MTDTDRTGGARIGRTRAPGGLVVGAFIVLIALLMVPSAWSIAPPSGPSAPVVESANAGTSPTIQSAGAMQSAAATPIPGSNPSLNTPIPNFASLANQLIKAHTSAPATTSSPPASPKLPLGATATGYFSGEIANSTDALSTIAGVVIQAFSVTTGNPCTTTICAPVTTGSNGTFNVTCPAGTDYITALKNLYAENLTYATCLTNQTVDIGTILLVPDGIVEGTILADVNGTPPLSAVQVQGEGRDSGVTAQPTVTSNQTGGFIVPVPPGVAAKVLFTPPSPVGGTPNYQNNFTWVTAQAGQIVNIGTVYLEPFAVVKAELYSAVTGSPINNQYEAMTVCAAATANCGPQGVTVLPGEGHTVEANGPTGYDYVVVEVNGYAVNQTMIGYVPGSTASHPFCVPNNCRIYLTPLGTVSVKADMSVGNTSNHLYDDATGLVVVTVDTLNGWQAGIPQYNPATGTYNMTESTTISGGSGCGPVGSTIEQFAFPMRVRVSVAPDTGGSCGGPPTWPIPSDLPAWGNWTTANVTPYENTPVGYLNLTPGTYIMGDVYVQGTLSGPSTGYTVGVTSLSSSTLSTYTFDSVQGGPCGGNPATVFCVPAPPGDDKLTVTAVGYPQNFTMVSVPWSICCVNVPSSVTTHPHPLLLQNATEPQDYSINLSFSGQVEGSVILAGGSSPVPNAALTVCPAGDDESAICSDGVANVTGAYDITNVPPGWDYVTAVGAGDSVNGEWVYITTQAPEVAPPIPLEPMAGLVGQVLSTNGTPVIDASITYCPVDGASLAGICTTSLGAGQTQSDGQYFGLVQGGWLPWSTYEIEASAPGYVTDWTFVNASANTTTTVPNLFLQPVGSNSSAPIRAARSVADSIQADTWVDGRVVDNTTGVGVSVQTLNACSIADNQNCVQFTDGTNTGGFFNQSLPTGSYNLTVMATGYYPLIVPFQANTLPSVNLGAIAMNELQWIQGNVTLDPWNLVRVNLSASTHAEIRVVPPSQIDVCTQTQICTTDTPVGSGGNFEVQSFDGNYLDFNVAPIYNGGPNSATGGVRAISVPINVTAGQKWVSTPVIGAMPVFGAVSGTVWNAASYDVATGNFTDPARWISISAQTLGPNNNGVALATTNGAGDYTVYLPGGNKAGSINITASDPGLFYENISRVWSIIGPEQNLSVTDSPISLIQYGFAVGTFVDQATGVAIPGMGLSSSYNDALQQLYGSSSGIANTGGFVNITAPAGNPVLFTAGASDDYNGTAFIAAIASGQATNVTGPNASASGLIPLPHWGWVSSAFVNYSTAPAYSGTVVDAANQEPLPFANVEVTSPDVTIASGGSALGSNLLGEFLADAPIGPKDKVTVTHPGYVENTSLVLNISTNEMVPISTINLTGYGVVAGRVISVPGNVPVPSAQVTICPGTSTYSTQCTSTVTNATGWYWITAVPGHDSLSVAASGYVSNYTQPLVVASDSWQRAPDFVLIEDGTIIGIVHGLPTGLPLEGALVSACSPYGTPTGPCEFSVGTESNGSFDLAVTPGQFVLAVTMNDFNSSYLPVYIPPGGFVNVGSIPINEYGVVAGTVVDAATGAPIENATVNGCPLFSYLACDTTAFTDLNGVYHLASPPGAVAITVTAAGFNTAYLTISAVSGSTTTAPTISMIPLATQLNFVVSGHVLNQATGAGLAGAVISFESGPSVGVSTVTGPGGGFSALVSQGVYNLVATDAGFATASETLSVTSSVEGVVLTMPVFTWTVTVQVEDGLLDTPIAGAAVWSPSALLGLTGSNGVFAAQLPNGSYDLTVMASGSSPIPYGSAVADLSIIGSSSSRTIDLFPPSATLSGVVTSQTSGSDLSGVTVSVVGTAVDGATATPYAVTGGAGTFSFPLYEGTYTVSVNAPGYVPWTQNVSMDGSALALPVALQPVTLNAASSTAGDWAAGVAGIVLVAVAATAVALWGRKGNRSG